MGYLFLAVAAAAVKGFCGKKISGVTDTVPKCIGMNLLRMGFCVWFGFLFLWISGTPFALPTRTEFPVFLLSGISMTVFVISWMFAVRRVVYVLVSACTSAAFVFPMLAGLLFFDEHIGWKQIIGIGFIAAAILLLIRHNDRIQEKIGRGQILLLALVALSQGLVNTSQKMFTYYVPGGSKSLFNLYTFLFTWIFLCVWALFYRLRGQKGLFTSDSFRKGGYIVSLAAMLFLNSYFLTTATERMQAVILYPLNSVLCLAAGTLMSVIFFRERMTKNGVAGLVCVTLALLLTQ